VTNNRVERRLAGILAADVAWIQPPNGRGRINGRPTPGRGDETGHVQAGRPPFVGHGENFS
jgi:hypothetical protein